MSNLSLGREFWRQHIQPGMNVIDIGASFGVDTFSAASRVEVNGMVYAIESDG